MNRLAVRTLIPAGLAVAGTILILLWARGEGGTTLQARVPGTDRADGGGSEALSVFDQGRLRKFDGKPSDLPGAWPRFRGPNLDGISDESIPLLREWGPQGPPVVWALDLGEGYAGAAVLNGRAYVLDYDRNAQADALRCLSLADGAEIWRYSYPVKVKRNHGMSRTVCAVTDRHVVGLGPKCHVVCLDAASGEFKWGMDLVKDYETQEPPWYAGQCPLIDGDKVILAPGGMALMMAVDPETGQVLWKTPNPRRWQMSHASIVPTSFRGRKMYVYCASGGVAGVSAEDGALLWETDAWKISIATVPTPVPVGDGRIFLSGGYNAGSMMLQLKEEGGRWVAEPAFRLKAEVFGAAQQTPIFHGGHLYGVRPNGELVCLDLAGNVKWSSGVEHRFGLGPFLVADGALYVLNDDGLLSLIEATPDGYRPLARAKVLGGHEAWGPLAIAGGRLIARDLTRMVCLDVRKR